MLFRSTHLRSYDKAQQIELPEHIAELKERKGQALEQRGMSQIARAAPASVELLEQAAHRGENIGSITSSMLLLLDRYPQSDVQAAVQMALARGVPHPNEVLLALETPREARKQPPPLALSQSKHAANRDTVFKISH